MELNQLVITTVRPDSKATMRGSYGQQPRKKRTTAVEKSQCALGTSNSADLNARLRPGALQLQPTEQKTIGSHISPLNAESLGRLEVAVGRDIGVWAESQAMDTQEMAAATNTPLQNGVLPLTEGHSTDDDGTLIDPITAPRLHIRVLGVKREVWKPGDGDGDEATEWFGRTGVLPINQRWRVFQTDIGPISGNGKNIPPKCVFLDDSSAFQVLSSDIARSNICKWWPHDFCQPGKVRRSRAHIGRAAIKDDNATGNERYLSGQLGGKAATLYYFSGEANYVAVRYRLKPRVEESIGLSPTEAARLERKRKIDAIFDAEPNRRAHGHNQYTPRDMLVKHGAKSGAKPVEKFYDLPPFPRPHHHLRSAWNPIHVETRLVGGIAERARESVRRDKLKAQEEALREASIESLRAALQEREAAAKRLEEEATEAEEEEENEDNTFPTQRPPETSTSHSNLTTFLTSDAIEPPINIPRELSFIERRAMEQRLITQTLQNLRSQDDVQAMAKQIATEKITVGQQEKTIALLERKLRAKELEAENWKEVAEEKEALLEGLVERSGEEA